MGDYDILLEMVKQTNDDLRNLRDNHLVHLQDDVSEVKDEVMGLRRDVDGLMSVKKEITDLFRQHARFLISIFLIGVLATFGLPLMAA